MNTRFPQLITAFGVALLCGAAAPNAAQGAPAGDAKATCGAAYEGAQESRGKAALLSAREQLLVCSRDECPKFIRKDCVTWLEQVTAALPSLVIAARDQAGNDLPDAKLEIDGKPVTESLSLALDVDPGEHSLTLTAAGFEPMTQQVVLREGEQRRRVEFVMLPPGAAEEAKPVVAKDFTEPSAESADSPLLAYVLGGVGVLGLGAFAYFGLSGESKRSDLEGSCKPNCSQSEIDDVDQSFLFADISLGVGVVSLGVAAYLLLSGSSDSSPAADSARALPVRVIATPGGGYGAWSGSF